MCEQPDAVRHRAGAVAGTEHGVRTRHVVGRHSRDVQHEVHGVEGRTKQEAAKAVEERTKVTASEQQHATDAEAKVNEQDTLADRQIQAAVATGSVTGHGWNPSMNAVRDYVPLNNQLNACQQVDD